MALVRKIEDIEWLVKIIKDENRFLFLFHVEKSKFFVNFENNTVKKYHVKYLELILQNLLVYYDLIKGTSAQIWNPRGSTSSPFSNLQIWYWG